MASIKYKEGAVRIGLLCRARIYLHVQGYILLGQGPSGTSERSHRYRELHTNISQLYLALSSSGTKLAHDGYSPSISS